MDHAEQAKRHRQTAVMGVFLLAMFVRILGEAGIVHAILGSLGCIAAIAIIGGSLYSLRKS